MVRMDIKHLAIVMAGFCLFFSPGLYAQDFSMVPAKGMVTMVDLGAKKCIPCKMMAPILAKLEKAYQGKAKIAFIDVWINLNEYLYRYVKY